MTKEEYEQCKIDQFSDDIGKRIQALLILSMFPDEDTKIKMSAENISNVENKLRVILGDTIK